MKTEIIIYSQLGTRIKIMRTTLPLKVLRRQYIWYRNADEQVIIFLNNNSHMFTIYRSISND